MYSETLTRITQFKPLDQAKHLHFYLIILTLLLTPLSTSLSTLAYFVLTVSALYQIKAQHRWHLLIDHPLTRIFWPGAVMILIGCFYSSSSLTLTLSVTKKYFWFFATPLLLVSIDGHIDKRALTRSFSLYLSLIALTVLIAYYRVFVLSDEGHSFQLHLNNVFKDHIVQSFLVSIGYAISLYRLFSNHSIKQKILYSILCVVIAANLLFTNEGRTGYILMILITLYTPMFYFKKIVKPCLLALLLLLPIFYLSPSINNRWHALVDNFHTYQTAVKKRTPLSSRLINWEIGIALFKDSPFIGYGTGGIKPAKQAYLSKHDLQFMYSDKLFDSSYLNFLVQFGLLGLIYCLYFLGALWYFSSTLSDFDKYLSRIIILSILFILWINPWLSTSTPSHLISVLVTLLYTSAKQPQKDKQNDMDKP